MKHSQAFALFLNIYPEAIDGPLSYLGPNWETILNFWTYIDSLTVEQWKTVGVRYSVNHNFDKENIIEGYCRKNRLCEDIQYCTWYLTSKLGTGSHSNFVAIFVSYELFAMHDLLNDGHELYFIPLFGDL
jgi:hypothetical protein